MNETICLNGKFSTTKRLSILQPSVDVEADSKFESMLFLPERCQQIAIGGLRTKGYFKTSSESKPLISIVTVVYNGEAFLAETIQSVLNQNYDNVEYIIIDGGSSDGTLDIIKKYEEQIDYWVSEPDNGIYDAMNKGILLTTGLLVGIINADDFFLPTAFSLVINKFINSDTDVFYGDMNLINRNSQSIVKRVVAQDWKLYVRMSLNHPATFIKREIYVKYLYSTEYAIASDYHFFLQAKINKMKFEYVNVVFTHMRNGGVSDVDVIKVNTEVIAIRKKLLGSFFYYVGDFFSALLRFFNTYVYKK